MTIVPVPDTDPPTSLAVWAAVSKRKALTMQLPPNDQRKWVLALTVDGKPVTIEGHSVSIDGWSCVDASPDGKAVAAGDLVQHGEPVVFPEVDAQAELQLGPKVGDLHPWDALVDGCLYIDDRDWTLDGSRPFYYQLHGLGDWVFRSGRLDGCATPDASGQRSEKARVIATGIENESDITNAAIAYVNANGGAK